MLRPAERARKIAVGRRRSERVDAARKRYAPNGATGHEDDRRHCGDRGAPQDNPAYRQAYRDAEVARLAAKRIGAEHLPTVDLCASYSRGLNPNLRRHIWDIRQKLFDSYLDALKLQLKLKSVLGTLDEQSLVAVDSFLEGNAAGRTCDE
ncbi:hypothetical protein WK68_13825 [Burkholderia ubonensis]|nr:hypothetical protein WK68_13825 [Burkholderia ubonensis]